MTDRRRTGPPVPLQAVLSPLTGAAIFLVATIDAGGEARVRQLLADLAGLQRSVGFRIPAGELSCVTGFGAQAWDRLLDTDRPPGLHRFVEVHGARHQAPATPGDLLFHIRAARIDLCFALATEIVTRLHAAATVVDEVQGFKYFDERDLLGFVDGTENPVGEQARQAAIIDDDSTYAGGSYVVIQKYLHDLTAWNQLPVPEQERIIGRTKLENIELPDDVKPGNSHVTLNTIVDADGTERAILRDNMPFGSPGRGEFGTYYIAHRVCRRSDSHRAHAPPNVCRRPARQLRPDPRLLEAGHRGPILRPDRGLPGRPAGASTQTSQRACRADG